ncbi:MAG: hypothetical protein FWD01_03735 [Defluviitaleaceae bacterium]|nr:hypothetical protein [Defluviitaleaceae bacterium]
MSKIRNLWNVNFDDFSPVVPPIEIIKEQCDYLEKATNGKLIAKALEIENSHGISATFYFNFYITSSATPNFKYEIMSVKYGVPYYPVHIKINSDIAEELWPEDELMSIQFSPYDDIPILPSKESHTVSDEDIFMDILGNIINSKKVREVMGSLMYMVEFEEKGAGIKLNNFAIKANNFAIDEIDEDNLPF